MNKMFLNYEKENLKMEEIDCGLCGSPLGAKYYLVGFIDVEKRAGKFCKICRDTITN